MDESTSSREEYYERRVLNAEREIRSLVSRLEARDTKTLGNEYAQRVSSVAEYAYMSMRRARKMGRESHEALRKLINSKPRAPREETIATLRQVLELLFQSRADSSDRRARMLEREIRGLQEQVAELSEDLKETSQPEVPEEDIDLKSKNAIFIIMPFASEFEDVWKGGIRRAAEDHGFHPVRVDEINRSSNITDDIIDAIQECHLTIVDVTGNNPNVMFELGFALAEKKPHIIISQSTEFLPFDIRNIRTIEYSNTWSGIEELRRRIADYLSEHKNSIAPKKTAAKRKTARKRKSAK